MQVLIIGSGGREHALAWKVAQSDNVSQVYVAPGNAGTALEDKVTNLPIAAENIAELKDYAIRNQIDLTIVGPEAPLVAGICDEFHQAGLKCFGPSASAARLEGSKAFTKEFLLRHSIPTAEYQSFTDVAPAIAYVRKQGLPIVVKADGLAAGKGVVIAETLDQAEDAIRDMLEKDQFGQAGKKIVVEEFLKGQEASFIVAASGTQYVTMATSQDHKARDDNDRGPNTGGMGAYSPAPIITSQLNQKIIESIIEPTLNGLMKDGIPYLGFLYAGLMITDDNQVKVLEFNCRFGDPETQPIMMRLQSDLSEICMAALSGSLSGLEVSWAKDTALGVVMTAGGYPGSYDVGKTIFGLPQHPDPTNKVFHAGTATSQTGIVTAGGRVLCVTSLGKDVREAHDAAYRLVETIRWDDVYYRTDIGHKAM